MGPRLAAPVGLATAPGSIDTALERAARLAAGDREAAGQSVSPDVTTVKVPATAREIAAAVGTGRVRAVDVCAAALRRLAAQDDPLGAFLQVFEREAVAQATRVDEFVAAGQPVGPLAGVPIAIKDNLCTRLGRTTCGSRMLAEYRSPYDATVIDRLVTAGAVIVGKTNLDEFAMGSSTENSGFHPTRNPWNHAHVPGGSSGGSAAAVAADMVPVALGSDTGGSIRQPASFCGVVGVKPTYGRVSRYGLVAYGSSLDQVGPLARCVEDAAAVLGVIAGADTRDATCVVDPVPDYVAALRDERLTNLGRLRIGIPRSYFGAGLECETRAAVEAALAEYERLGAELVEVELPRAEYAVATYYLVATAEASSNLARYDGVHYGHRTAQPVDLFALYSASRDEGFGPEVKRRIMLGTFALSAGYYDAYYQKALQVRQLVRADFEQALTHCDVIAGPAAPTAAFRLGEKLSDPLAMYLADIYTIPANLAGLPALVVPCGFTGAGLPVGLQLCGRWFGEERLLQVARLYERATTWHERRPPVAGGAGPSAGPA